jgi:hypothetical protein
MRTRLTYANVVSTACLFIVLGGSAAAATKLITGKQIKNNSISSADIKDRSLLRRDFKRGQLVRGPVGPQGVQGAQGQQGPQGPPGFSDAFNQGLFQGGPGLQLAAGSWWVEAQVDLSNTTGTSTDVTCTMTITAPGDAAPGKDVEAVTVPAGAKVVLPLIQIHQIPAAGSANVDCSGPFGGQIFALKVQTTHEI